MVPQAMITARARTVNRGAAAPAAAQDAADAHAGEQLGAGAQGQGHVRDVGRALGVRGTAEATHALAVALGRVAQQRFVPGQAQALAPAGDHAGHAAEELDLRGRDPEHALDALVIRLQVGLGELV